MMRKVATTAMQLQRGSCLQVRAFAASSSVSKDSKDSTDSWNKAKDTVSDAAKKIKEAGKQKWDEVKDEAKTKGKSTGEVKDAAKLTKFGQDLSGFVNSSYGDDQEDKQSDRYQSQSSNRWNNSTNEDASGSRSSNSAQRGGFDKAADNAKLDQWQMEAVEGDRKWQTQSQDRGSGFRGNDSQNYRPDQNQSWGQSEKDRSNYSGQQRNNQDSNRDNQQYSEWSTNRSPPRERDQHGNYRQDVVADHGLQGVGRHQGRNFSSQYPRGGSRDEHIDFAGNRQWGYAQGMGEYGQDFPSEYEQNRSSQNQNWNPSQNYQNQSWNPSRHNQAWSSQGSRSQNPSSNQGQNWGSNYGDNENYRSGRQGWNQPEQRSQSSNWNNYSQGPSRYNSSQPSNRGQYRAGNPNDKYQDRYGSMSESQHGSSVPMDRADQAGYGGSATYGMRAGQDHIDSGRNLNTAFTGGNRENRDQSRYQSNQGGRDNQDQCNRSQQYSSSDCDKESQQRGNQKLDDMLDHDNAKLSETIKDKVEHVVEKVEGIASNAWEKISGSSKDKK